jgi:hypothetical protein
MHYRFIALLVCFISLQSSAVIKQSSGLRRIQTDYNLLSRVNLRAEYEAEKLALMKAYIKELQEKKLLQYVRESNSCGYFPHSGNVYEANSVSTNDNNQGDWYP